MSRTKAAALSMTSCRARPQADCVSTAVQPLNSKPSGRRNLRDWFVGRPSREAVYTGETMTTTGTTDSLGAPIQLGTGSKLAPLHSREFNPEDAENPTMMSFDGTLAASPAD